MAFLHTFPYRRHLPRATWERLNHLRLRQISINSCHHGTKRADCPESCQRSRRCQSSFTDCRSLVVKSFHGNRHDNGRRGVITFHQFNFPDCLIRFGRNANVA